MEMKTGSYVKSTVFVLFLLMSALFIVVAPYEVVAAQNGDYTYSTSGSPAVVTITGYTGAGGDISIPSTLGDFPVVAIGDSAFSRCASITSVAIPDGIVSIGSDGFRRCTSLTAVTIADSVISIGDSAFEYCTSLTSVITGNGVASIGNLTFYGCSALISVNIPAAISSVGGMAFTLCSSLIAITVDTGNANYASVDGVLYNKTLTALIHFPGGKAGAFLVPESVVSIGMDAFYQCKYLTTVTISRNVTSIGVSAFSGCAALNDIVVDAGNANYASVDGVLYDKAITTLVQYPCGRAGGFAIPDSVTSIGWWAFWSCSKLTSVSMPDGITIIDSFAFEYCSSLTSVVIGKGVVSIRGFAFWGCTSLTSVIVPDGLASIGAYAFAQTSITSFTIKAGITMIEDAPFYSCAALNDIVVDAGNANYASVDGVLYDKAITTLVQYPCGKAGAFVIPSSVVSIRDDAFASCVALTSITIPNSVTTIGGESFLHCTALTSVTVGSGVTTIGDYSFLDCGNLTSISFFGLMAPTDVGANWLDGTSVSLRGHAYSASTFPSPGGTFHGLMMSSVLPIPEDYTYSVSAGNATITGYTGAGGNITIPSSLGGFPVVAIGNIAFLNCTSLTAVTIPNSVTVIGTSAFAICTSLTAVTIPNSVTVIGDDAFVYCGAMTSLTIPDGITTISHYSFAHCTSLTAVTIPDSVITIGQGAFYNCNSLISVTITDSVVSIEHGAFSYCTSLASVTIPNSVTSIGDEAFAHCTSLISMTIPNSVTAIGRGAFLLCTSLTSLTIPNSVTSIGSAAFLECSSLISMFIPSSVAFIGDGALAGCSSMFAIDVDASNLEYASVAGVLYNKTKTTLLQYPSGKAGSFTIPGGVTSIGVGAFYRCTSLISINITSSVASIENLAFYNCTSLTSILFLGLNAPNTAAPDWIIGTNAGIRGHAYTASNFPAPGSLWNGLMMGAVIPAIPGAPTNLTATSGNGQVVLTWAAPASDGGSAITAYKVYLVLAGGSQLLANVSAATFSYAHTNVTAGTTYTYYVVATNAIGAGPNSAQVRAAPQNAVADNTMLYAGIAIAVIAVIAIAFVLIRRKK